LSACRSLLAGTLLPTVVRMARRNPEPALAAAAPMLRALRLDLSAHVAELWPALLQQSRHAREAVRALAAECVAAAAAAVADPSVVEGQVEEVVRLLDGTAAGKIKAAAERASLAALLAALAAAPGRGPTLARVAGRAVDSICRRAERPRYPPPHGSSHTTPFPPLL
jgi:hypothetical protein